jgi:cytochrome c-type biogenesis protein CcmH
MQRHGPGLVALLASALIALTTLGAAAKEAPPEAADPALEARMTRITSELRCLVCQNQTIADSTADLAADLRRQTRELLKQGKSDQEIVDYMTARYGDFVLYRPPLRTTTALLWFGPALMLVGGGGVLIAVLRRRTRLGADAFDADDDDAGEPEQALLAGNAGRGP